MLFRSGSVTVGVSLLQPVSRGSSTAIPAQNRAGSAFFNRVRFSGLWRMVFLLLVGGSAAFCTLKIKKATVTEITVDLVEHRGFEPLTSTLPVWRAPNCANAP